MKSAPLTPDQAARELGVSRNTVYGLIASGELEAIRIKRALRIEPKAIERFKAAHRVRVEKHDEQNVRPPMPRIAASGLGTDRYVS